METWVIFHKTGEVAKRIHGSASTSVEAGHTLNHIATELEGFGWRIDWYGSRRFDASRDNSPDHTYYARRCNITETPNAARAPAKTVTGYALIGYLMALPAKDLNLPVYIPGVANCLLLPVTGRPNKKTAHKQIDIGIVAPEVRDEDAPILWNPIEILLIE